MKEITKTKEFRLPKEFAEKWVKALRSGVYTQGSNQLFNERDNSYCCLGLACEIAGHTKNIKRYGALGYIDHYNSKTKRSAMFPNIPNELYGGERNRENLPLILAKMNDDAKSFSEIADWIEENVEFY